MSSSMGFGAEKMLLCIQRLQRLFLKQFHSGTDSFSNDYITNYYNDSTL